MSRYIGLPDSVYQSQNAFLSAGTLTGIAYGAINAGELCMLHESGALMRVDPNLPWSAINQSTQAPYQLYVPTKWVNVPFTGGTILKTLGIPARLVNRNYAVPCQTSAGIGFIMRTSAGLEMSNYVNVSSDTSTTIPHSLALSNGNHVIIWHVSANLKFAVYDGYGNLVTAPVTASTVCQTSGMVPWHGHCVLGNGNFALTFCTTAGAHVGIIYGPNGSVVVSQFTIDSSCTGVALCTAPCANGDFVAGCFDTSHTAFKLYRITNAGSITWGPVSRSSATAIFSWPDAARQHPQANRLFELMGPGSTPNICWMLPDTDTYCKAFLHTSAGALAKKVDIGSFYHNAGWQDPACLTPFGFCMAHAPNTGPSTFVSYFDWSGNPLGQNHQCDNLGFNFPQGVTPNIAFYNAWAGAGVAISRYAGGTGFGGTEHRLIHVDPQGYVLGVPFNPLPFGADDICTPYPQSDWDGTSHDVFFTSSTLEVTSTLTKIGRSAVIGVAQASAANGASVTITAQGYFQLPSTQVFGPGTAFDNRDLPILGCRGTVGGQIAVLGGWSL
jgi:hypothetical protein